MSRALSLRLIRVLGLGVFLGFAIQQLGYAACNGWKIDCAGYDWRLNTGSTTKGHKCVPSSSKAVGMTAPTPGAPKDADYLTVEGPGLVGCIVGCGQKQFGHIENGIWVLDGGITSKPCGAATAKDCAP